jgi:hypothetical protein
VTTTDTTVAFESKAPHTTCLISLDYPEAAPPTDLIQALAEVGFAPDGLAGLPPLDGRAEVQLVKRGSDLFGGWTAEEQTQNMRQARAVLKRFGFARVPHDKRLGRE